MTKKGKNTIYSYLYVESETIKLIETDNRWRLPEGGKGKDVGHRHKVSVRQEKCFLKSIVEHGDYF
jgi:hypothetical protein